MGFRSPTLFLVLRLITLIDGQDEWEEYYFGQRVEQQDVNENNIYGSVRPEDRRYQYVPQYTPPPAPATPTWFTSDAYPSATAPYSFTVDETSSKPFENSMRGTPKILCNERSMGIQVETTKPYSGRLFVSDHANDMYCVKRFEADSNTGMLEVPIGACDMKITRLTSPRAGIEYSATVVASFHPEFLTEYDRLFHLKCSYYQSAASIGSYFEVSVFPTEVLTSEFALPDCTYTLHTQTIDGPQAEFAKIGDKVFHRWECDTEFYSIKVKSCYVDDGKRRRYQLIDSHGCSQDPVLLPDVIYNDKTASAYAKSHVFKFADSSRVFFHCQVLLCFKGEIGCGSLTPPDCTQKAMQLRRKRAQDGNDTITAEIALDAKEERPEMEITSAELTVVDLGDEPKLESYVNRVKLSQCSFCLSQIGFAVLIFCNLLTLTVATITSIALCRRQSFRREQPRFKV